MSNIIQLFKQYVPILDDVYKEASKSAVLDGNPELVRAGATANELVIPKISMDGLADYTRSSGYVDGNVTLTNETVTCNFDRGRMFTVDSMDNMESAGIAFGRLAGEFIRTKVVPELDAFRFARYASLTGISKVSAGATLNTGADVIGALRAAINAMDEDEVPMEGRYLFITPTLLGLIQDLDTTKSREVLSRFVQAVQVPQTRFYTAIDQRSGKMEGTGDSAVDETAGGYAKATGGKDINFLVIHKDAPIQFTKHLAPKVISPEQNQTADAWKFGYRMVGIADAYENKAAGIYLHHKG